MELSEKLVLLRGAESRASVAERLKIQESTLRNYEKALSLPNFDITKRICVEFGVTSAWLLFDEGPMRPGEAPQPAANAPEKPVIPAETLTCSRCAKLEAELEEERRERRELSAELREVNAENRKLSRENGDLKARCATLSERQKTCCPEPLPLFKKTDEDQGAPNNVIACA